MASGVVSQESRSRHENLALARTAIGLRAGQADVRSLRLTGTVTEGFNGATGEFGVLSGPIELRLLAPDRFLRIKQWRIKDDVVETRQGFRGDAAINSRSPEDADAARYHAVFLRLGLGLVLWTDTLQGLEVSVVDGQPYSLQFTGAGEWQAIVDFDETTRLPRRLRYTTRRMFPGRPSAAGQRGAALAPVMRTAEVVWTLDDHREAGGLMLPHRITEVAGGVTFSVMQFDRIDVNPPLTEADFPLITR